MKYRASTFVFALLAYTACCNANKPEGTGWVSIGDPGNQGSPRKGMGAVEHIYEIGIHEVTIAEFRKARDRNQDVSNGNEDVWLDVGRNAPAANVSWYEAAKYCNYLTTGNPYQGVYRFRASGRTGGADESECYAGIERNYRNDEGVAYRLPTEPEWFKAAFYNVDKESFHQWSNASDLEPGTSEARYDAATPWQVGSGTKELNGTYDMMGNLWEWTDANKGGAHVRRGGSYGRGMINLRSTSGFNQDTNRRHREFDFLGFRIVRVSD